MSVRRILREILAEWKDFGIPKDLIRRDIKIDLSGKGITVITGARRAGKTYILFQLMKDLLEAGVDERRIFYINFEDERIEPKTEFLTELIPAIREEFGVASNIYLFLDEIHNIPKWDKWLRRHELKDIKFIITGSTCELMPDRISEALGGRTETYVVYPLSFNEFLRFKGIKVEQKTLPAEKRAEILRLLEEYMTFGGFPEVTLLKDKIKKVTKLQEYFSSVIYRDIVRRGGIDKIQELETLVKLLADTTLFSASKMENILKNVGFKVSKATILRYKDYAEKAYLIFQTYIFSKKVKDVMQYPRKIYFVDTGLRYWVSKRWKNSMGNVLENLVFLLLLRNLRFGERIYYWRGAVGYEVDFVVVEGLEAKIMIQVAYNVSDYEVKKREIRSLIKAMKELETKNAIIITWDYEGEETIGEKMIRYIPVWKIALGLDIWEHPKNSVI